MPMKRRNSSSSKKPKPPSGAIRSSVRLPSSRSSQSELLMKCCPKSSALKGWEPV
jgi:hypothetical protein